MQLQLMCDWMRRSHQLWPELKSASWICKVDAILPTDHGRTLLVALRPQNWACALVTHEFGCPLQVPYVAITWFSKDLESFSRYTVTLIIL